MKIDEGNRLPRKVMSKVDLSQPINYNDFTFEKDDCFGGLWNMEDKSCRMCHDNVVCGILFSKKVAIEEKKIQAENETFLDTVDFQNVNKDALALWLSIKNRTVEEVFEYVTQKSSCSDEVAVVEYIKRYVLANKFRIRDSIVYVK
jgi:hypothetical protein